MQMAEAEGSTIDEAIDRALQLLGVARDKAEVEIIRNASKGMFGIGGSPARVRASLRRSIAIDDPAVTPPLPATREVESRVRAQGRPAPGRVAERTDEAESVDPEMVEKARPILQEIVRLMGVEAQAQVEDGEEGAHLSLAGDGSGILIGRQGQTLDALEYLVNRIASREEESRRRITVDTEGYRGRRRSALEQLAKKTAAKARTGGRPITLDPMSPRDRRVIHLALQGDASLGTRSTGEGYYKQVVIVPRRTDGRRRN